MNHSAYQAYRNQLRDAAARWFTENNKRVQPHRPYILQRHHDWPDNIIIEEVVDYINEVMRGREKSDSGFALHQYVHHGLSSQAMLFNLVGPLIVRDDLDAMRPAFEAAGVPWPNGAVAGEFEFEDREVFNERQSQPTSIDLVLGPGNSSHTLFVEAKLTEQDFGGCSLYKSKECEGGNPAADFGGCPLHKKGRKYWALLEKHQFLRGPMSEGAQCQLADHYQFFRECLFALEKHGHFVLLADERSPVFLPTADGDDGLLAELTKFVPEELRGRMAAVTIQGVMDAIRGSGRHGDWIERFRTKYGMDRLSPQPGGSHGGFVVGQHGQGSLGTLEEQMSATFLTDLFRQLNEFKKFPKYQYERRIDPFISIFLPHVLKVRLGLNTTDTWPEFPVRSRAIVAKTGKQTWAAQNIDYACYDREKQALVLVELKTDVSSVNADQLRYYNRVLSRKWEDTKEEIDGIRNNSGAKGKYDHLLSKLRDTAVRDDRMTAVYLAPASAGNRFADALKSSNASASVRDKWSFLSLEEFANTEIETPFQNEWATISGALECIAKDA